MMISQQRMHPLTEIQVTARGNFPQSCTGKEEIGYHASDISSCCDRDNKYEATFSYSHQHPDALGDNEKLVMMTMQRLQVCRKKTAASRRVLKKFKGLRKKYKKLIRHARRADKCPLRCDIVKPDIALLSSKSDKFELSTNSFNNTSPLSKLPPRTLRQDKEQGPRTPLNQGITAFVSHAFEVSDTSSLASDCSNDSSLGTEISESYEAGNFCTETRAGTSRFPSSSNYFEEDSDLESSYQEESLETTRFPVLQEGCLPSTLAGFKVPSCTKGSLIPFGSCNIKSFQAKFFPDLAN